MPETVEFKALVDCWHFQMILIWHEKKLQIIFDDVTSYKLDWQLCRPRFQPLIASFGNPVFESHLATVIVNTTITKVEASINCNLMKPNLKPKRPLRRSLRCLQFILNFNLLPKNVFNSRGQSNNFLRPSSRCNLGFVVVVLLVEWSLLMPEIRGLNPVIGNFIYYQLYIL